MLIKILLPFIVFIFSSLAFSKIQVYLPKRAAYVDYSKYIRSLPTHGYILLGEYHYTSPIQEYEGKVIKDIVQELNTYEETSIFWEFLNYTDQEKIDKLLKKYKEDQISASEFLGHFFSNDHTSYVPLVEAAKTIKSPLFGTNIPRPIKQKLIQGGLDAIPAHYIPENMEVGGNLYLDRFKEVMGDHAPGDLLKRYFLAQCFTDSVISNQINVNSTILNILVIGSFHTDYFHGTVSRLKKLTAEPVTTIKLLNVSGRSEEEINSLLKPHPKYGIISDAVFLVE